MLEVTHMGVSVQGCYDDTGRTSVRRKNLLNIQERDCVYMNVKNNQDYLIATLCFRE